MVFQLSPRQVEANRLLGGPARHIMLRGGGRSGKTLLLCRAIAIRAMKAPESTHAIVRLHLAHLKASIVYDTWPRMMSLCYQDVPHVINKSDWFVTFQNKSRVWFAGLDDKERTDKILGQEHSTIFLNECSQISYHARNTLLTRLAQNRGLVLKAYYDQNPPPVGHWTYRLFEQKVDPKSGERLEHPELYATMQLNPIDNAANLRTEYLELLQALPERERRRFWLGEYQSQVEGALWTLDTFQRVRAADVPQLQRVMVGVDPSGCAGPDDTRSDEIGIVVAGRDQKSNGYVLDDLSGRYSPEGWAKAAVTAYDKHSADCIVAEANFGGAMVQSTIRSVRPTVPVRLVKASRGKAQRAEPVAALYEQNKVKHAGTFPDLEDQLCGFSTAGYQGSRSPDRADAAVWALTELMLGYGQQVGFAVPIVETRPRNLI